MRKLNLFFSATFIFISSFAQFFSEVDFGYANPVFSTKTFSGLSTNSFGVSEDYNYSVTYNVSENEYISDTSFSKINFNIAEGVFAQLKFGYTIGQKFNIGVQYFYMNNSLFHPGFYNNYKNTYLYMENSFGNVTIKEDVFNFFMVNHKITTFVSYSVNVGKIILIPHIGLSIGRYNISIEENLKYNNSDNNSRLYIMNITARDYIHNNVIHYQFPFGLNIEIQINNTLSFVLNSDYRLRDVCNTKSISKIKTYFDNGDFDNTVIKNSISNSYNITTINTSIGIRYYFGKKKEEAVE